MPTPHLRVTTETILQIIVALFAALIVAIRCINYCNIARKNLEITKQELTAPAVASTLKTLFPASNKEYRNLSGESGDDFSAIIRSTSLKTQSDFFRAVIC